MVTHVWRSGGKRPLADKLGGLSFLRRDWHPPDKLLDDRSSPNESFFKYSHVVNKYRLFSFWF